LVLHSSRAARHSANPPGSVVIRLGILRAIRRTEREREREREKLAQRRKRVGTTGKTGGGPAEPHHDLGDAVTWHPRQNDKGKAAGLIPQVEFYGRVRGLQLRFVELGAKGARKEKRHVEARRFPPIYLARGQRAIKQRFRLSR